MVSISSWRSDLVTGVLCPKIDGVYPRLPSRTVSYRRSTLKSHDCVHPMFRKVPGRSITHLSLAGHAVKCASFVDRNYQSSVNDDEEPFLINSMKQAIWTAKSILLFLAEQPTQLKYIEWPGFQSTEMLLYISWSIFTTTTNTTIKGHEMAKGGAKWTRQPWSAMACEHARGHA
ncbi:uncharacterized protein LOC132640723 isoform X4 [Lycium barbarum]|nr:uncharacterized protein LOC132640723 isoform X4 [Lycium barbarum]